MADEEKTSVAQRPPDQEASNIEAYARIFRKCLDAAKQIIADQGGDGSVVEIAEAIFKQFYHDQVEMVKQQQLINMLKNMMASRGF